MSICRGVSDTLRIMLESSGDSVITKTRGGAGEILAAFVSDRFHAPLFCMPRLGGKCNSGLPGGPKGPFPLRQRNPHSSTAQPSQTIKGVISQA